MTRTPRALALLLAATSLLAISPARGDEPRLSEMGRQTLRRVIVVSEDGGLHSSSGLLGPGYLGIETTALTPELRRHFGAPANSGLLVARVEPDAPAARAGIRVGDVLTRADGEPLPSTHTLLRLVRPRRAGAEIRLDLVRDRHPEVVTVDVAERDRPEIDLLEVLPRSGVWEQEGGTVIEVEGERLALGSAELTAAIEALRALLADPEWMERVGSLREEDAELEGRMVTLERRLAELRRQIDELAAD